MSHNCSIHPDKSFGVIAPNSIVSLLKYTAVASIINIVVCQLIEREDYLIPINYSASASSSILLTHNLIHRLKKDDPIKQCSHSEKFLNLFLSTVISRMTISLLSKFQPFNYNVSDFFQFQMISLPSIALLNYSEKENV